MGVFEFKLVAPTQTGKVQINKTTEHIGPITMCLIMHKLKGNRSNDMMNEGLVWGGVIASEILTLCCGPKLVETSDP